MTSKDLRVAVLGVGKMGTDHVQRLTHTVRGARVSAVSDYSTERAAVVAAMTPHARVISDPIDAIADPDVDAVILASPAESHEKQLLACLEAGKPVLCEKPLTADESSALDLVRAEAALGKKLIQVGFMRRFDREYEQLKALIDAETLGAPLMLHCMHRNPAGPDGFDSVAAVRDSQVHEVDVIRYLLGEEIASVHVLHGANTSLAEDGIDDPLLTIFQTTSGRLVDVELFIRTGIAYEVRTELIAERGTALIGLDIGLIQKSSPGVWGGTITPGFSERFGPAYDRQVQQWVNAATTGTDGVYIDGPGSWDGYAAAVVCAASIKSVADGAKVTVDMVDRASIPGA
jgi:myo-inositol 2-dehydrogenase / D-chiro-inositol 1-dehydrogenase